MNFVFYRQILEYSQISNFMKIRPMGAVFFQADGYSTDRHDEAKKRFLFFQFREHN